MKKSSLIVSLLLSSVTAIVLSGALSGCSAGATGTMKPAADNKYESVIEYSSVQIQSRLSIADIRARKVGDILQVGADLRNEWKWELDFQYKFKFFDKDGFEVNPGGRQWTPITITGNEVSTVQAVAPNPLAESFKIIVRD